MEASWTKRNLQAIIDWFQHTRKNFCFRLLKNTLIKTNLAMQNIFKCKKKLNMSRRKSNLMQSLNQGRNNIVCKLLDIWFIPPTATPFSTASLASRSKSDIAEEMEEDFALEYHLPICMHCKRLCISLAHKGIFKLNTLYVRHDI